MKLLLPVCLLILVIYFSGKPPEKNVPQPTSDTTGNIIIITLDGFRWQEVFRGADDDILQNSSFTTNEDLMRMQYGGSDSKERRVKLMPFFWSVIAKQGMLFGNRDIESNVNVSNIYGISYPGYNEMFSGRPDLFISGNQKKMNKNKNVLNFLAGKPRFANKVAAVTSWDVFPFILNTDEKRIYVNSGYSGSQLPIDSASESLLHKAENEMIDRGGTRNDILTFLMAKEYLQKNKPKIFFLGLGETDEFAHAGNYNMYLQKANESDRIIADLWQWCQTNEGYRNNTTFIITTDHGRGRNAKNWHSHSGITGGSNEIWVAFLGKGIEPKGEIFNSETMYQYQIAQTIAHFSGEQFGSRQPMVQFAVKN